eukprot:553437_1
MKIIIHLNHLFFVKVMVMVCIEYWKSMEMGMEKHQQMSSFLLLSLLFTILLVKSSINEWSFSATYSSSLQSILGYPNTYNTSKYGWTGGDADTSIQISDDIYLWLFGDSFIGNYNNTNNINERYNTSYAHRLSCNPWPHSTVGLYNVTSNNYMSFYIRTYNNCVASFFQPNPMENDDIYRYWWTVSGIANKQYTKILILAANILCSNNTLGFTVNSTSIIVINNYMENINNPLLWNYEYIHMPHSNSTLNWYAGINYIDSTD